MNIYTGKRINSYEWKELPIDDDVITQVELLAKNENAKHMTDAYPMFEWAPGLPILDEVLPTSSAVDSAVDDTDNNDIILTPMIISRSLMKTLPFKTMKMPLLLILTLITLFLMMMSLSWMMLMTLMTMTVLWLTIMFQ